MSQLFTFSSRIPSLASPRDQTFMRSYRAKVVLTAVCLFGVIAMFSRSDNSRPPVDPNLCALEDPNYKGQQQQIVECTCANPTLPESWFRNDGWKEQHDRLVKAASTRKPLDLVILGDSITERINGTRSLGKKLMPENRKVFESHFTKTGGGSVEAIALGSSGDTSNNLLWHLENGMLPDTLQPKVWWILIGTNNLGRTGCSQQSTLDGILAVLRYLHAQRPTAKIILHGLLPRSEKAMEDDDDYKTGAYWKKIQWINQRLGSACNNAKNCVYMESPEFFMTSVDTVDATTMTDGLHPSTAGLEQWEPKIVEAVQNLL